MVKILCHHAKILSNQVIKFVSAPFEVDSPNKSDSPLFFIQNFQLLLINSIQLNDRIHRIKSKLGVTNHNTQSQLQNYYYRS